MGRDCAAAVCALVFLMAVCPSLRSEGETRLIFETDHVRLVLSADGKSASFSRRDGTGLLADPKGAPFMLVRIGKRWHNSVSFALTGSEKERRLRVGFHETAITAEVAVRAHAQYLEFETLSLAGPGSEAVEQWAFVSLPVNIAANAGMWLNVAWDDAFAAAVIALEEKTRVGGAPLLRAFADRRLGFASRKAALIACPTARMLDVIRDIEREHGLPSPSLGGQWAKTSLQARKSWMITGITGTAEPPAFTTDRIFALAKSLGVEYVVMGLHHWNATFGRYVINPRRFPDGVASLKKAADQAHAMGLKLGLHVMTASITKNDPYATPVPDPRLRKEGEVVLARDVDAAAREIPTVESPADFGVASGYWAGRGVDVQIGDEIIRYAGIRDTAPFALLGCTRGAYGTKAAPHKAGAKVMHLAERYGWYVADNDLAAEIGRNVAEIINQAGLDMVCFDGADVLSLVDRELQFFNGHQVPLAVLRNARRDVLLVSNGTTHFGWHVVTRGGEDDAMARGYKRWVDDHTVHRWGAWHWRNLLVPDFSWVGIFGHTPTLTATRPDDVALVCARSLGYDGAVGWGFAAAFGGPSGADVFERNGRREEICNIIRTYEKLRLENYFSREARAPLREQGSEWGLVPPASDKARYRLAPVRYLKSGVVRSGAVWKLRNDSGPQPCRVRIEALAALAPYGAQDNVVIADFEKLPSEVGGNPAARVRFGKRDTVHAQVGSVARLSCEAVPPNVNLPAKLAGHGQPAWAQVSAKFPEKLNLAGHRAVGLWINGDGGGEILNVQLEVAPQSYLHFYQPIDFTGWKYCELAEPEGDRVMDYFSYDKFALHNLRLDAFTGVTLMVLNPPRGRKVELEIGRIEALKEIGGKLADIRLAVAGAIMQLPVSLEPEQYLETGDPWGDPNPRVCRVFDANGKELQRLMLAAVPDVPAGECDISLEAAGKPLARAKVTVMLGGQ